MALRLLDDLQNHARTRPAAAAVRSVGTPKEQLTFLELHRHVLRLAEMLRARIPTGSTVLLCRSNRPSYITSFLGVLAAGNTVFPLSSDSAEPEFVSAAPPFASVRRDRRTAGCTKPSTPFQGQCSAG